MKPEDIDQKACPDAPRRQRGPPCNRRDAGPGAHRWFNGKSLYDGRLDERWKECDVCGLRVVTTLSNAGRTIYAEAEP